MNHETYDNVYISGILNSVKTVAIVGASANDVRPSFFVTKYLIDKGYEVFPVNPGQAGKEILGRPVYASLAEIFTARDAPMASKCSRRCEGTLSSPPSMPMTTGKKAKRKAIRTFEVRP